MNYMVNNEAERALRLADRQAAKMARSPHAFVRGNTAEHYEWLSKIQNQIPEGPSIWICGDCHLGNLGPLANSGGKIDIQIRDLDQTVVGNPAHDLIRLALSLASAARGSNLSGTITARMIEDMLIGYEAGLTALDDEDPKVEVPEIIATVKREAFGRTWRNLAKERIEDVKPTIPLGKKFWALSAEEKWNIGVLLDSPAIKGLILALNKRSKAKVELVDSAYWVKGCSSLGKLRYAALVHVSGERRDRLSLVDIKEAVPSVAPASNIAAMPSHLAERVVAGAKALAPNLGERMAAGDLLGKPVVVRELMPEDLKLDIDQFTRKEAIASARFLSSVVGRAHGRQMPIADRKAWMKELSNRHPPDLAAPTWLWNTVLALLVHHEEAYLKHCRLILSSANERVG